MTFKRLCCSNCYHLNLSWLATPGCATPKQQYLKSSVWVRLLHKLFPIAHLGMSLVESRKHTLLVYNKTFFSERIQDPKGHLCFLDALLHHEVNTSWSFLLLPSGNPYHTLLPSAKENLGIKKANPKRSFSLKMMDLTGSPKSNSQLAIWLIRIRWAKALLSKGDLWSLWETPGCEVQL